MTCFEISPNLEAYALGALDQYTAARVASHLKTCAACRLTLASFNQVVGELPAALSSASPLIPPVSLKNQIMQLAQEDLRARDQVRAIHAAFGPHATAPALPARRGHWLLNPRLWIIALASSMVLIVMLVGLSYVTNLQMEQALSREQLALAQLGTLQANQQEAFALAASSNKREIVLRAPNATTTTYGKLALEANKPTVLFTASGLAQPGLNERYYLWTVNRGAIQLVGQFTPNRNGFAMLVFMADREDPVLKEVFVTRQPISRLLPSNERILSWRADPNDLSQDLLSGSAPPHPTIIRPVQ